MPLLGKFYARHSFVDRSSGERRDTLPLFSSREKWYNENMTVQTQCKSCGGTGIYHGFAEPHGVGVVCLNCGGTGCYQLEYTPFEGRKHRYDISTVQRSRGSLLVTGVGPAGNAITYNDFLAGRMP